MIGLPAGVFGPLRPLVDAADWVITFLHDDVGLGWGMAIVGLTVIIRLILVPLTMKQIKSMNALKVLQPQMKEIQEKYKDDPQRKQQEMMKFYKANNVNPLSSCFPLLLQLPVFFALFQLLNSSEFKDQLGGAGWGFVDNLAAKPEGAELVILLVIYVGSQLASSVVMAVSTEGPARIIMFVLPFAFIPIIINFPAGLIVYWITTNLWTFGQQVVVRRVAPPVPVAAGGVALAADSDGGGSEKPPPRPPKKKKRRSR